MRLRGDEYQRIASLHALRDVGSARLEVFLSRAEDDVRYYLVDKARRLRSGAAMAGGGAKDSE